MQLENASSGRHTLYCWCDRDKIYIIHCFCRRLWSVFVADSDPLPNETECVTHHLNLDLATNITKSKITS